MRNGILCCSESGGLTLDLYVFIALRHGDNLEISRSCLFQGAHGDFSNLTTKSTVKRQASSNFYRDQEKPGRYVSEFKDLSNRPIQKDGGQARDGPSGTGTVRYLQDLEEQNRYEYEYSSYQVEFEY